MYNRRNFIKTATIAGTGLALLPALNLFGADKEVVRLGFIGVGLRGQDHLELALRRNDVEVVAICDIQQVMIESALKLISEKGKAKPKVFNAGPEDYKNLLSIKELDAVVIATPWEWHFIMATDAMKAGKFVGCEVVAGTTLKEHWNLIKTFEETQTPYMLLENVCYRRDIMAIMNMVRQNLFGELIHLQAGYQHDLREVLFNNGSQPYGGGVEFGEKGYSEAKWRTNHYINRNGELYPSHGIGPVAMMTNINRGNRFTELVSYSSKARGLHEYIVNKSDPQHPNRAIKFEQGDIVTTMIKCSNGETILLQYDTALPRPYSLGFRVQGTKGLWMDVNKSIYLEGLSKEHDRWEQAQQWLDKYDHPLWQKYSNDAEGAGHGGMDFFVIHAFIECVKRKLPPPIDIYDAVTWSAISPLSESSIADGGKSLDFPDFTKGKWKNRKNDFATGDDY